MNSKNLKLHKANAITRLRARQTDGRGLRNKVLRTIKGNTGKNIQRPEEQLLKNASAKGLNQQPRISHWGCKGRGKGLSYLHDSLESRASGAIHSWGKKVWKNSGNKAIGKRGGQQDNFGQQEA